MFARCLRVTTILLVVSFATTISIASSSRAALATHNSSPCKWDFPWPRSIEYYIRLSSTTQDNLHLKRRRGSRMGLEPSMDRASTSTSRAYIQ